jgi:hypothetical protein
MPYGSMLSFSDPFIVDGMRTHMETCWLPRLDSGSIEIFIRAMETAASSGCAIVIHDFKAAASRVPPEATAFGLRRDHVLVEILASFSGDAGPCEVRRHLQWARATRRAFDAMALPGGYPNLLASKDTDRAAQSYGPNAPRLMAAKRRYDPDNVFASAIPLPADAPDASSPEGRRL